MSTFTFGDVSITRVVEIPRSAYRQQLKAALAAPARFYGEVPAPDLAAFLQSITQTS